MLPTSSPFLAELARHFRDIPLDRAMVVNSALPVEVAETGQHVAYRQSRGEIALLSGWSGIRRHHCRFCASAHKARMHFCDLATALKPAKSACRIAGDVPRMSAPLVSSYSADWSTKRPLSAEKLWMPLLMFGDTFAELSKTSPLWNKNLPISEKLYRDGMRGATLWPSRGFNPVMGRGGRYYEVEILLSIDVVA